MRLAFEGAERNDNPRFGAATLGRRVEARLGTGLVRAVLFDRLMKQNNNRL